MAYMRIEYCLRCQKETEHWDNDCSECVKKEQKEATANWNALPIEEKLQDLRKRIEELELRNLF